MSQIDQFMGALKRALKSRNILYKDLAKTLGLSESSIKRILSNKSLSLERLEEICIATDLSFADICRSANFEEGAQPWTLSDDQERSLSENSRLLQYYMLLYDGKSPLKIEKEYDIENSEAKKFLFQLDRLDLIELHPRDRVKIKRKGSLRFRKEGAVGKALFTQTKAQYLNHDFLGDNDFIRFSLWHMSPTAIAKFRAKLERLTFETQEEVRSENERDVSQQDIGVLLAYRPWQYSYMDAIRKRKK